MRSVWEQLQKTQELERRGNQKTWICNSRVQRFDWGSYGGQKPPLLGKQENVGDSQEERASGKTKEAHFEEWVQRNRQNREGYR